MPWGGAFLSLRELGLHWLLLDQPLQWRMPRYSCCSGITIYRYTAGIDGRYAVAEPGACGFPVVSVSTGYNIVP